MTKPWTLAVTLALLAAACKPSPDRKWRVIGGDETVKVGEEFAVTISGTQGVAPWYHWQLQEPAAHVTRIATESTGDAVPGGSSTVYHAFKATSPGQVKFLFTQKGSPDDPPDMRNRERAFTVTVLER